MCRPTILIILLFPTKAAQSTQRPGALVAYPNGPPILKLVLMPLFPLIPSARVVILPLLPLPKSNVMVPFPVPVMSIPILKALLRQPPIKLGATNTLDIRALGWVHRHILWVTLAKC